jgi:hypothetical protein
MRRPSTTVAAPDWQYLWAGLRRPALALLVAGSAWGASQFVASAATTRLATQEQALASESATRAQLATERSTAAAYADRYARLAAAGAIGTEQRLGWAATLRDLAGRLDLPYLRFSTGPQVTLAADQLPADAATTRSSTMEIQAGLVHEGDLLRLLAGLRAAPGLFSVQACRLERSGTVEPEPGKANLAGICQLQWLSVDPQAPPPEEPA